jgi:hypothetical protein
MDGRIGHLHSHYHLVSAQATASGLVPRLDRIMRGSLLESYEKALTEVFRDDEAVYVLRRVRVKTTLMVTESATDSELARRWGEQLAGAVVRAVAGKADEGVSLIRFDNQADYVAHFIVALLNGRAWSQWFYGAFASLRNLSVPRALGRVLLDNREHLSSILGYAHRYDELDSLVATLDTRTRSSLWLDESEPHLEAESLRPLFLSALLLVDGLRAWAGARPEDEELFQAYLRTAPPSADWQDRRALTISVCDVLRFLFARGHLRLAEEVSDERFPELPGEIMEGFDWLDGEWLQASLLELLGRSHERRAAQMPAHERNESSLPVRMPVRVASPRQRELLTALVEAVDQGGLRFSGDGSDFASDALRLLALLVAHAPQWAESAAAKAMIQNLLTVTTALRQSRSRTGFMLRLRRGDVEGALSLRAQERGAAHIEGACRFVSGLGEQALALVEKLAGGSPAEEAMTNGVESDCAGLSLLLRAMLDVRLHGLAEEAGYPPRAGELPRAVVLLLSLGLQVCGEAAVEDDRLDRGLCLLAGLKERQTLDALRAHWAGSGASAHARFQAALLNVAAGQRLLQPSVMHLFRIGLESGETLLVAGDESALLWPLGRVVETDGEIEAALIEWLGVWEDATGVRPSLVADESVLVSDAFMQGRGVSVTALSERDDLRAAHETGRTGLVAAFAALGQGRLGTPDADSTLALLTCVLLRLWARWLGRFSSSSIPYLLENFIRRGGRLHAGRDCLLIELERRSLDIVLEMAGYVAELERVPWLDGGRVRFSLRE